MKALSRIKSATTGLPTIQLEPELSPAAARALIKLRFSQRDVERMHELAAKAQAGTLTPDEQGEIQMYEQFGCFLGILQSKARVALKKRQRAN